MIAADLTMPGQYAHRPVGLPRCSRRCEGFTHMTRGSLGLILGLTALSPGCSFYRNTFENIHFEPLYACTEKVSHHRHEVMGREAFKQMALAFPDQGFSCAYREGFVDGFADYLDWGGNGEPSVFAPPGFRLNNSLTPAGYANEQDWFAGFRHGAATAKASGLRNLVTLPTHWPPKYDIVYPPPTTRPER